MTRDEPEWSCRGGGGYYYYYYCYHSHNNYHNYNYNNNKYNYCGERNKRDNGIRETTSSGK